MSSKFRVVKGNVKETLIVWAYCVLLQVVLMALGILIIGHL